MSPISSWKFCYEFCLKQGSSISLKDQCHTEGCSGTDVDHMTFSTHTAWIRSFMLSYQWDGSEPWCIRHGSPSAVSVWLRLSSLWSIKSFGIGSLRWIWPKTGEREQIKTLHHYQHGSNITGLTIPIMKYKCYSICEFILDTSCTKT